MTVNDPLVIVILSHAASTLAMTGLIWFVQIVHYPLFAVVGEREFPTYEVHHARRTSYVVVPLMLVEAGSATALVALAPGQPLVWIGLVLLAVVWLSTFLLQVPRHRRLQGGFVIREHRRLVHTNWLRTIAWTVRSAVALRLVLEVV